FVLYGSCLEAGWLVEYSPRAVLFFPSLRFFPCGFPWEGFLKRQYWLAVYTPMPLQRDDFEVLYGRNGNMNAERQNKNQAFNAGNGLTQNDERVESSNSVRRLKSKNTKWKNRVLKSTNNKSSSAHVRKVERVSKWKKDSVFIDLASKITNIDRKMICEDGKPLRAVRRVVFQDPITVVEILNDMSTDADISEDMRSDCNNDGSSSEAANIDKNVASGNVNGISLFASLLRPKSTNSKVNFHFIVNQDKVESSDCVLPKAAANKGRISFSRALIEINVDFTFKKKVIMAIPENERDRLAWQQKKSGGSNGSSNAASTSGTTKKGENNMPSPPRAKSDLTTLISNPSDVLNTVEEDASGHNVLNTEISVPIGNGSSKVDDDKVQEEDNLWSRGGFSLEDDDLDCYDGYEA
nr:hypothetical protein [Tanacetum cinerariifolium]